MTLKANVRLYGPTRIGRGSVQLVEDHEVGGIGDADVAGPGEYWAYIDLNHPGDFAVHQQQSSALDLRGTLNDFRWLVEEIRSFIRVNEEELLKQETE